MLYPIVLFIISILGVIFTYLSVTKKINILKKWTVYICIALIPVFLIFFPIIFLKSFVDEYTPYYTFVAIGLIGIECFMLLCYCAINFNIFPEKFLNNTLGEDKAAFDIKSARLLVHYSLFSAVIYFIPILVLIRFAVNLSLFAIGTLIRPMFLFILSIPLAVLSGIVFLLISILCVLVAVFSINAVIRASYLSKGVRKHLIRHIIFMFIPVFNIISLFQISLQLKKDLNLK